MSLPALLAMDPRDAAVRPPYLHPAPELVELWCRELAGYQGLKVGIAWQGNAQFRGDRFRSVRLEEFLPFAPVHGITLISLQKGYGSEQVGELNGRLDVVDLAPQLDNQRGAFVDTAAVMANLDLVITTDTAAAHLAGALGVPVWVALRMCPSGAGCLPATTARGIRRCGCSARRRQASGREFFSGCPASLATLPRAGVKLKERCKKYAP